jgi:hypothetical protein
VNRNNPDEPFGPADLPAALQTPVAWSRTGDIYRPFSARVSGQTWVIRLGEFPEDPLYTLLVDGAETGSFSAWPQAWQRPERPPDAS